MMFISKTLALVRPRHVFLSKLCMLELYPFSRSISTCSIDPNQPSFEVSYLINSCWLSLDSAKKVSKLIKFESPEKPDLVLAFFENHGFSQTQVSKLIKFFPALITSNTEKTLLPKLQFFYSKGISVADVAKIVSAEPNVLRRSVENHLIPTFDFFTKFLQFENSTINAIKRLPSILAYDLDRTVVPVINISRAYGVSELNIMKLLTYYQVRAFRSQSSEKFREIIEEVKKIGFDPSKVTFVVAINILSSMSKPTWERKVEVYQRWGWSHEEILHAFRKHPVCMMLSEENISAKMDFFINKMGWDPSIVAHRPIYVYYSLEKRIIPRCSVLSELLSKGLIKKKYSVGSLLESTEKLFLQKYVNCYEFEAPHLLKIYHEKLGGTEGRGDLEHNFRKNGVWMSRME